MVDNINNFFSAFLSLGNTIFTNILNLLWNFLEFIIKFLFSWINIPAFPDSLKTSINSFFDLVFNNLQLLGFFIRPATIKIVIPFLIVLFNFKYIYKFAIWIIHKIPFLNLK